MESPELRPRLSRDGKLETTPRGWRLIIPAGGARTYRLAQLDDQAGRSRRDYPWRAPQSLRLRARAAIAAGPGTWGFGLWNDPYGFSFGPGEILPRLPALPQAVWFFAASPRCYLSFRDDKPARGLYVQVFHSGGFGPDLVRAALSLPLSPRSARRFLRRVIQEDGAPLAIDPRDWHSYSIDWSNAGCTFRVDAETVLQTGVTPQGPLGLVLWIDNQYAAFDPDGHIRWGVESSSEEQWLEVADLTLAQTPAGM